jgi:hypothetical protein
MSNKPNRRYQARKVNQSPMLFGKKNYTLMAAGFAILIIGFLIMRIENQIDGVLSLFLAPWIIFAGFIVFGYGILKKNPALDQNPS